MRTLSNEQNIPLSLAVYLANDNYDFVENTISATGLMRPIRQQVLSRRLPPEHSVTDISVLVQSRTGSSIHDGLEQSWLNGNYKEAMAKLGYAENVISRIQVNPTDLELKPDGIPVYLEQRMFREFMGKTISGKYDFIGEGRLEDLKTTTTFTWVNNSKSEDYRLQGSIYNWLDKALPIPRITETFMAIQMVFTDWKAYEAARNPKYPQHRTEQKIIQLLSLSDTETYIRDKINLLDASKQTPEDQLPRCTDKELWRKPAKYKYYKDPLKTARSTKNFDSSADAFDYMQKNGGGQGIVIEVPGEVIACKYCAAFPICTQKDEYLANNSLRL
jgi:hypothetical protein